MFTNPKCVLKKKIQSYWSNISAGIYSVIVIHDYIIILFCDITKIT